MAEPWDAGQVYSSADSPRVNVDSDSKELQMDEMAQMVLDCKELEMLDPPAVSEWKWRSWLRRRHRRRRRRHDQLKAHSWAPQSSCKDPSPCHHAAVHAENCQCLGHVANRVTAANPVAVAASSTDSDHSDHDGPDGSDGSDVSTHDVQSSEACHCCCLCQIAADVHPSTMPSWKEPWTWGECHCP